MVDESANCVRPRPFSTLNQVHKRSSSCCLILARPLRMTFQGYFREVVMKRREFLKSVTAVAASTAVSAPAVFSPAKAQSRAETLLIVSESGPNNLDIHGVGTNVPGYEVSWNCYDRLISHEMKTVNGNPYYDKDKFKMELADDMKIGDMSVTFKLKKKAVLDRKSVV